VPAQTIAGTSLSTHRLHTPRIQTAGIRVRVRDICRQRKEILNLAVVFGGRIARLKRSTPSLERLMQNV
jgi:hypothetical protein